MWWERNFREYGQRIMEKTNCGSSFAMRLAWLGEEHRH
jgi:hypothetical protein